MLDSGGIGRHWPLVAASALAGIAGFSQTALAAGSGSASAGSAVAQAIPAVWWLCPIGSIAALVFAYKFYKDLLKADPGDERMVEIAEHVKQGSMAYLRQQYKIVAIFFVFAVALLCVVAFGFHAQSRLVPFAFLTGGFFSGLAGFFGMKTATSASNRTTAGAKESLNKGLQIAFRSGAVMGLVVVGLGLLDISLWFFFLWIFRGMIGIGLHDITVIMLCFGFGASTQALFARVGGGIYTKAADVGADLVGKVEAGIPEDDPRNPATIADNVGDNVGDVAGMGADLYESYCGSILASAALGVAAMAGEQDPQMSMNAAVLPMVIAAIGIIFSIAGVYVVKTEEGASQKKLLWALGNGIIVSSILVLIGCFVFSKLLLGTHWLGVALAVVVGLVAGLVIGLSILYYTSPDFKPTQGIAKQTDTGPATVIIAGIAEGMASTAVPVLAVIVGTIAAYALAGGFNNTALGLYGVGVAAVGMLSTLGITLATDAYGPIADNAGGNAEMSGQEPYVRERTDALDALGNTTAATGKGFAIGSAALTALALLAAYMEEVRVGVERVGDAYARTNQAAIVRQLADTPDKSFRYIDQGGYFAKFAKQGDGLKATVYLDKFGFARNELKKANALQAGAALPNAQMEKYITDEQMTSIGRASMEDFMAFYRVTLMNPKVLCGMFFGAMLTFVFCAMTMKAVGRAAGAMVTEVRRQFREIAGIMEGTATPDYARCVQISTEGAQREMIVPSLMALVAPVFVGVIFGVSGVMGLLAGGLVCGFSLAIMMANAGGAWDNAKKFIENEDRTYAEDDTEKTNPLTGKGSARHKASVVGDTVGDPFKDTSGPSLNILIKLMSMVSVVFAGLVVKMAPIVGRWLGLQ